MNEDPNARTIPLDEREAVATGGGLSLLPLFPGIERPYFVPLGGEMVPGPGPRPHASAV